jgi:hypothetical protein
MESRFAFHNEYGHVPVGMRNGFPGVALPGRADFVWAVSAVVNAKGQTFIVPALLAERLIELASSRLERGFRLHVHLDWRRHRRRWQVRLLMTSIAGSYPFSVSEAEAANSPCQSYGS